MRHGAGRRPAVTGSCALSLPSAERGHQLIAHVAVEMLFAQRAQQLDGALHLPDVVHAGVAVHEVLLEPRALVGRQLLLEVLIDELHEFAACQIVVWNHTTLVPLEPDALRRCEAVPRPWLRTAIPLDRRT